MRQYLSVTLLLIADVVGALFFYNASFLLVHDFVHSELLISKSIVGVIFIILFLFYLFDLYGPEQGVFSWPSILRLVAACFLAIGVVAGSEYIGVTTREAAPVARRVLIVGTAGFLVWAGAVRYARFLLSSRERSKIDLVFVGTSEQFDAFRENMKNRADWFNLHLVDVGRFRGETNQELAGEGEAQISKAVDRILDAYPKREVALVYSLSESMSASLVPALLNFRLRGLPVYGPVEFIESYFARVPIDFLRDTDLVGMPGFEILHKINQRRIKQIFDFILALVILVFALPVVFVSSVIILIDSGLPIFFTQERVGFRGKLFRIVKLRTMVRGAEKDGEAWSSEGDARITRSGRLLRRLRIDELPQVVNVIKGDMSFIGPRPERPGFTKSLISETPYFRARNVVLPGITGWAQVNYKYGSSIEDSIRKLEYDIYYIKNYSLFLDLAIVMKTIKVVLSFGGR